MRSSAPARLSVLAAAGVALAAVAGPWTPFAPFAPGLAHADEAPPAAARHAVVAIEIRGDADPQLRAQVEAGIASGVERAGATVIAFDDVQAALADKPALQGCVSTTCLAQIGALVDAREFVTAAVSASGANYDVELARLDADGNTRRRTATCTVCTITELAELVADRVHDLITATAGGPQPVTIDSRPGGARLTIPGLGAHPAPWHGELAPGTHVIEARLDGHATARQEITLDDTGEEQRFEILLAPVDVSPWRRRTRWAVAGAAAAAIIGGVVLLALDGDPTCDVDGVTCPEVYGTGGAGLGLSVLGVVAGGTAGWMFWTDR